MGHHKEVWKEKFELTQLSKMHEVGRVQFQFSRSNMGKVPRKKLSIKYIAEACSEPCQTPKMELFAKIVDGWHPLNIFTKSSILDVWQFSEYPLYHRSHIFDWLTYYKSGFGEQQIKILKTAILGGILQENLTL